MNSNNWPRNFGVLLFFSQIETATASNGTNASSVPKVKQGGFFNLEFSTNVIANVPYGIMHLSVWKHFNKSIFYVRPVADLLEQSAKSQYNILSGKYEVSFHVLMWSREAQECVFYYLINRGHDVRSIDQVEMLPIEKIRIVWRDPAGGSYMKKFSLGERWKSNVHLPNKVSFKLVCESGTACVNLLDKIVNETDIFDMFEIEYVVSGQRSARRTLTVRGSHLSKGNRFAQVSNFQQKLGGATYLVSRDINKIAQETVTNLVSEVMTDASFVSSEDEMKVAKLIEGVLCNFKENSLDFDAMKWESVFWDDRTARPDKVTNELVKDILITAYTTDTAKQEQLANANWHSSDFHFAPPGEITAGFASGGAEVAYTASAADMIGKIEFNLSSSSDSYTEDQARHLRHQLDMLQSTSVWEGERYVPKPMDLFRNNVNELKQSTNIVTSSIQLQEYEAVFSTQVSVASPNQRSVPKAQKDTFVDAISDDLFANIHKKVSVKIKQENSKTRSLSQKRKSSAKKSLNNELTNYNKITEELVRNVSDYIERTSKKQEKELTELSANPPWPKGDYCVWAPINSNKCPHPDFNYVFTSAQTENWSYRSSWTSNGWPSGRLSFGFIRRSFGYELAFGLCCKEK